MIDEKGYLILCLLDGNPYLTGAQAEDYAIRIIQAEQNEDYQLFHGLIQEAIYGQAVKPAA
ncbi:MAG: hypothetical protein JXA73_08930 [Acidobacteria bacterium]|nr:hypothetical protein [Acidobacteriota bacterium]